MVLQRTRRATDARSGARKVLRRFLARPIIGVFLVVPLLGAFLEMGMPEWLLTVSGVAALYLALDLFLAWLRRPVPAEAGSSVNLLAWVAGIGVLAAAGWTAGSYRYHGELVALVGTVTAVGVGLGSPRSVAVLWAVAAGAAVAVGTSVAGPLTGESAMVAAAIAVGVWFGAVIGAVVDRFVRVRRVPVGTRAAAGAPAAVGAPATVGTSGQSQPARVDVRTN
ncbi:MAG TPA: hypothetical protein VIA02_05915 [Candidatus Limnocylindria bacterium]